MLLELAARATGPLAAIATSVWLMTLGLLAAARIRSVRAQRDLDWMRRQVVHSEGPSRPFPWRAAERLLDEIPLHDPMSEPLCRRLVEGAGLERLTRQASSQTVSASRRITALRALTVGGSLRAVELLERALECDDEQVVTAAIALLGLVRDRRAAVILMQALRACAHRAPKAAASLDALPLDAFDVVVPLAADESPCNRAWAAVLMRRYGASAEVQRRLAALAGDADPHVRHTALGVLGDVGGQVALDAVQRRLTDSVGMVRARAARALASMGATESAWRIAVLLGDREWTVRSAACDALTSLGPAAALALGPAVASDDPFVRDSAAAVMRRLSGADPGGPGVSGLEWRVDDLAADGLADVDEAIA